jgi:hypothetical protein
MWAHKRSVAKTFDNKIFLIAIIFFNNNIYSYPKKDDRYSVINKLWQERAAKDWVLEKFGSGYEIEHEGIIYRSLEINREEPVFWIILITHIEIFISLKKDFRIFKR